MIIAVVVAVAVAVVVVVVVVVIVGGKLPKGLYAISGFFSY